MLDRRGFIVQTAGSMAGLVLVPELEAAGPRSLPETKLIGLIGAGRQGKNIIAELQKIDGAKLVAVAEISPERLKSALERAPGVEGFSDHRALLEKRRDLDAVIVATPTHLHRSPVEEALQAGKHVYCEAPLAHSADDARAIAQAARQATGKIFMAGFQARSNPIYQLARAFYATDAFRDFVSGSAHYHRKTSWRFPSSDQKADRAVNWRLDPEVSTGLLGEIGAQQLDLFHWFRNKTPIRVSGIGTVQLHKDGRKVPDTVQALLSFDDGTVVHYQATLANSYANQHEVLTGSNATFRLAWSHGWMFKEVDATTLGWEVYALRQQFHSDEGIILIADATKLAAIGQLKEGVGLPYSSLYYALGDFLRSVTYPHVKVPCTAEDGLKTTLVGIRANEAVVAGTTLEMSQEERR